MENSNKTLDTKGGYKVELKGFITGRQKRHIAAAFTEDMEIKSVQGEQSFSLSASKADIANDRAIESVVISITGPGVDEKKTIVDKVLDLPAADYDEVLAAVEDITGDKKKEKSTPTT